MRKLNELIYSIFPRRPIAMTRCVSPYRILARSSPTTRGCFSLSRFADSSLDFDFQSWFLSSNKRVSRRAVNDRTRMPTPASNAARYPLLCRKARLGIDQKTVNSRPWVCGFRRYPWPGLNSYTRRNTANDKAKLLRRRREIRVNPLKRTLSSATRIDSKEGR